MLALFQSVVTQYQSYFSTSLYPLFFLLCLVFLLRPACRADGRFLTVSNLLFLFLIFCPVSAYVLTQLVGSLVYWRKFWMLTLPITISYAATELLGMYKKKAARIFAGLLVVVLLFAGGKTILSDNYFSQRMNLFKIPTEAIYTADLISNHAEENGIESPKAATTAYLSMYIREYDAGIRLAYGRNMVKGDVSASKLYEAINQSEPDLETLLPLVRKAFCQYLVLQNSLALEESLADLGFLLIGEASIFQIYFDTTL